MFKMTITKTAINLTLPFKNLKYYKTYINEIKDINLFQNQKVIAKYQLITIILAYESLHQLYIAFKSNSTETHIVANFNISPKLTNSNLHNLICFAIFFETAIYYYRQYLHVDYKIFNIIDQVLFGSLQRDLFMLTENNEKNIQKSVSKFSYLFVNLLQIFIFACDYLIVYTFVYCIYLIIILQIFSATTIFLFLFNFVVFSTAYLFCMHVLVLMAAFYISLTYIYYIAFKELYKNLHNFKIKEFYKFKKTHTRLLINISQLNKTLGPVFLIFLLLNSFPSAYILSWVINSDSSLHGRVYIGFFSMHQNFVIFMYHYIFSYACKMIHYPQKSAHSLMVKKFNASKICKRIRLHSFICDISVEKNARYGFTYTGGNLITMNSFFKV